MIEAIATTTSNRLKPSATIAASRSARFDLHQLQRYELYADGRVH
jgi:hypothetical protein